MDQMGKTTALGSVLDKVFCDRNWQYRLAINKVFLVWEEVVGEEIAAVAVPEIVKGDTLWVSVPDSMRMQQLHLKKMTLLAKINQRLREESKQLAGACKIPVIEDIRFKIGETERINSRQKSEVIENNAYVDPQREAEFDLLTRAVKDDELRDRIKRLWRGQEKRYIDRG